MSEEQVFLAALDLPDRSNRTAYLDQACGDNPELRRQVEELLAAHDRTGEFLDEPAAEQMAAGTQPPKDQTVSLSAEGADAMADNKKTNPTPSDEDADDLQFLSPSTRPDSLGRLGHYEMLQVLGRGGFGIVFRAFDDILQRVVAVKVMAPQIAALSPARKRFLREARSSAQVRHENVVHIYEVGEQPLPYLVMEFIPGETLQQKLDRSGPLDVTEVLRIGRQIAEGLAAAHASDLIHRDIKPGNILLEGGSHKAKITDFGLARAADDASISQSGIIAGTPMFMAPEQALGHHIDQRADLFSLGSVLYQMVSGRPPFRAPSALAVLKRVAEEAPRPIAEIIPETPDWLCGIIAKLHAKDPKDRFQSAREVADFLADCEAKLKAKQEVKNVLPGEPSRVSGRVGSAGRKWLAAAAVLLLPVIALAVTEFAGVTHLFRGQQPTPNPIEPGGDPPRSTAVTWGETVDPLGDCRFTEENGRLTITVPGDRLHDLNPLPGRNLNSPRVLREVAGDFEARVTVLPYPRPTSQESTGPNPPYVGAGLVVWLDEASFLRLFRANSGGVFVQAEWYNGLALGGQKWIAVPDGPLHLRIRRIGDNLHLASSVEGLTWTEVATVTSLRPAARRVGVAVVNAIKQEFTVQFEGFEVKELPPIEVAKNGAPPLAVAPFDAAQAKQHQEAWAKHLGVPVEATNKIGMKLILIPPAGVALPKAYYLGKYEVMQGEWEHLMGHNPSAFNSQQSGMDMSKFPVEQVSWFDCVEFCNKLSALEGLPSYYSLVGPRRNGLSIQEAKVKILGGAGYHIPTDEEWEHGCRAGTMTKYHFGDKDEDLAEYAWVKDNSGGRTHPVGEKKPNGFGLYDMHGNIREWNEEVLINATNKSPERISRGGDWHVTGDICAVLFQYRNGPANRHNSLGLRVARVAVGPPSPEAKAPPLAAAPFTDADVQRIAALPAAEQVEEVRKELMRRNPGFDGKFDHKIEGDVVTEFKIVTDQVTDIAPIRVWSALRVLDCSGTYTNNKPNGLLADLTPLMGMNLTHLTHLNLTNTKVSDAEMACFKDCKNLTVLLLSTTQVSDKGVAHFQDCKNLTTLFLNNTAVSDAGLAYFKDCKDLMVLYLAGPKVTDAGLVYFKDCKNFTFLRLGTAKVTDRGVAHFQDCKNLTSLFLNNTAVSDAGLIYFKDCTSLATLDLGGTKVSDAGLIYFKDCKRLNKLILDGTKLTDAGLATLKGLPLKFLSIYNTGVTDLTPLQGMSLEDIRLTPKNITRGLDTLRDMKSLKTIGIGGNQGWPAAEFWERYDKGEFNK